MLVAGQEPFSEGIEFGSEECPRSTIWVVNTSTGERFSGRCQATFCDYCGPIEAWWKARIISDGGGAPPERYMVLTLAPDEWKNLRQKMRNLRRWGREKFGAWEQAWTVEMGSKTGMRHVNVLQKGTFVPQAQLQERWGAIVHVSAIESSTDVAGYAMKEARRVSGYALKEAGEAGRLKAHLEANGNRLVHVSRGYLEGATQAQVRARLAGGESEDQWIVIPKSRT